jgi:hypothetical protein
VPSLCAAKESLVRPLAIPVKVGFDKPYGRGAVPPNPPKWRHAFARDPPPVAGIFIGGWFVDYDAAAVFITNGLPVLDAVEIHTLLVCRYSLMASRPFSRPRPEAL